MSDFSDTLHVAQKPLQCPGCGVFVAPEAGRCPHCGSPITPSTLEDNFTRPLPRRPSALQTSGTRHDTLLPDALVVLQLLPSGAVIPLKLMEPVTLGRFSDPTAERVSLADFQAHQHGISREHCRLARENEHLTVTDLGSTNGTQLNDEPLQAHRPYVIHHGDRLILGTLHILVTFNPFA